MKKSEKYDCKYSGKNNRRKTSNIEPWFNLIWEEAIKKGLEVYIYLSNTKYIQND